MNTINLDFSDFFTNMCREINNKARKRLVLKSDENTVNAHCMMYWRILLASMTNILLCWAIFISMHEVISKKNNDSIDLDFSQTFTNMLRKIHNERSTVSSLATSKRNISLCWVILILMDKVISIKNNDSIDLDFSDSLTNMCREINNKHCTHRSLATSKRNSWLCWVIPIWIHEVISRRRIMIQCNSSSVKLSIFVLIDFSRDSQLSCDLLIIITNSYTKIYKIIFHK